MKKTTIILWILFMFSIVFGLFGQGIAYFLNDTMYQIHPIFYLTIVTFVGIVFFLLSCMLLYVQSKKGLIKEEVFHALLTLFLATGIAVTLWSLFVLIMWWG